MREKLNTLVLDYGGYTRFAADFGMSERSIYMICKGKNNTTLENAFKIAGFLGSTVDELFEDLKPLK